MEFKEVEFIAQVDNYLARKDYQRGGRCVRFIAVHKDSQELMFYEDGVTTYTIDLSYWDLLKKLNNHFMLTVDDGDKNLSWFYIKGVVGESKNSGYYYETFSDDYPEFFKLLECRAIDQPLAFGKTLAGEEEELNDFILKDFSESSPGNNPSWDFYSFHVGQGMCSLITNGITGVLLDVGAGKPVLRGDYLKKEYGHMQNDLWSFVNGLEKIDVVISHPDSDHWRMLAWDVRISKKVNQIFIPHNTKSIAWKDAKIKHKIVYVSNWLVFTNYNIFLYVLRSNPTKKTDNTDCLICIFEGPGGGYILQSGDYVYSDMNTDIRHEIRYLLNLSYDAVVVPHHGDTASASAIFRPSGSNAKAFFSAGNHSGYGHPTSVSLNNHSSMGYTVISNNSLAYIKHVKLS